MPLRKSEGLRAPLRVECPETFGRFTELHHRASSAAALVCRWWVCLVATGKRWLITATRLTGIDVTAIAAAVREVHIRESFLCGHIRSSDAIADQVIGSDVELGIEHARNCAQWNVHYVVGQPPPIGKACAVAGEQTHAVCG